MSASMMPGRDFGPVGILVVELAEYALQLGEDLDVGDRDEGRRLREGQINAGPTVR